MDYDDLFRLAVREGASDLLIKTHGCPSIRVDGRIRFLSDLKTTPAQAGEVLEKVVPERLRRRLETEGEIDVSYEIEEIGRFRANVFRQRGRLSFVFRHVPDEVPTLTDLNLPAEQLQSLALKQRGLILATGVAGSGKTTTLASMIDYINRNTERHIVTLEDPIEYVYHDRKSLMHQREIGTDTRDFRSALKHVVRQSPDVIMLGEMRDRETMEAALAAAETGHLVMSTLHTVNAVQTVERIIAYFPPHQHNLIRQQLAMTLEGVISLRLIQKKDAFGRVPAVELMMAAPTIRDHLAEGKTRELAKAIYEGSEYFGSQTFNQSLKALYRNGLISYDEALAAADNPDELKLEIRGISKGLRAADFDFDF
jgi:twitching motility protein PilT